MQEKRIKVTNKEINNKILGINLKKIKINNDVESITRKKIDSELKEFYYLMNILECNNYRKTKLIKNKYINDITLKKYSEYIKYSCNTSKCLKCKRKKSFEYLRNRMIPNSDTVYFITVSSPFTIDNKELYIKKTKELRENIRNIFSYLKIPFVSSLEKGEKGKKLHIHLIIFLNTSDDNFRTSIYITDIIRAVTGYYTESEIINTKNKNKLDSYLSKMVGYASKFQKDKSILNDDNFIKLKKNNYMLIKTIYENNYIEKLKKDVKKIKWNNQEVINQLNEVFESNNISKKFFEVIKIYNSKQDFFTSMSYKDVLYILLSISFVSQQKVFESAIKTIKNNVYKKMKNENLAYKLNKNYQIEKTIFNQEYENKLNEFLNRFLKSVKTKFNYYIVQIEFLINKKNIKFDNNKIYSHIFFTSDIKKRILSNISIAESQKIKISGNYSFSFIENTRKNIYNGIELKNFRSDYDAFSIINNSLNLKYSKYRIIEKLDKSIYKNNVENINQNKNDNLAFINIISESLYRIATRKYNLNKRQIKNKKKYIENLVLKYKEQL